MEKAFFKGLDLVKMNVIEPTKMPRAAILPVVRDKKTGYLNAAPYSGSVTNIDPLHIQFGAMSPSTIESFREAHEFCVAVPSRDQINHMWVMVLNVPKGICEIDIAGWHTLPSKQIDTPGIQECPLNLECKKVFSYQLPAPWRAIIIGEVVGVSINSDLLELSRSEVVKRFPMFEAGANPETGLYGPSVLSGELIPPSNIESPPATIQEQGVKTKTFVDKSSLYDPDNEKVLINAILPRPAYILMTTDEKDRPNALPICGGSLQCVPPAIQVPVPKDTYSYRNIKRTGEFVIAVPDRPLIDNFERLEKNTPDGFEAAAFTLLQPNVVKVQGIAECPVNIDCRVIILEDVPGADYAILIGSKVGVSLDKEIATKLDKEIWDYETCSYWNKLLSRDIYAAMDRGMVRGWGFHDVNVLSIRSHPSCGNRYTGPWWSNYPLDCWLIELGDEGLITKGEYEKIRHALMLWNAAVDYPHCSFYDFLPAHFAEYFDGNMKDELREHLTTLFRMMAWAHRDYNKWEKVHGYLGKKFSTVPRHPYLGPLYQDKWYSKKI